MIRSLLCALFALLGAGLLLFGVLLVYVGETTESDWDHEYEDMAIGAGRYRNFPITEYMYDVDMLVMDSADRGDLARFHLELNGGGPLNVMIVRSDEAPRQDKIMLTKTLRGPGDEVDFSWEVPDDQEYFLALYNEGDYTAYADLMYDTSENPWDEAWCVSGCLVSGLICVVIAAALYKSHKAARDRESPAPAYRCRKCSTELVWYNAAWQWYCPKCRKYVWDHRR